MIKCKVHIEGSKDGDISAYNIELTVKNSDLEKIEVSNSNVNLQNVKDEELLWDSATKVQIDKKSIINADSASKIEVVPEE